MAFFSAAISAIQPPASRPLPGPPFHSAALSGTLGSFMFRRLRYAMSAPLGVFVSLLLHVLPSALVEPGAHGLLVMGLFLGAEFQPLGHFLAGRSAPSPARFAERLGRSPLCPPQRPAPPPA